MLNNFTPSANGLHYPNSWPDVPDKKIPTPFGDIGIGSASNGLCGGMAFAVRDLFEAHRSPPGDNANPSPDSPAFAYIVDRLFDSFNIPDGVAQYYEWMNLPRHDTMLGPHGLSWRTINDTMPRLRACVDSGHPCPLGLVCIQSTAPGDLGQNHQVLAYGYADNGSTTTVHVYDSNWPDRDDVTITFDHSNPAHTTDFSYSTGDHTVFGFFTVDYGPHDPSPLFQDGHATVHFIAPAPDATMSGQVSLVAHVDGASGIEFSGYYATDPNNIQTVGWRDIGRAAPNGSGDWAYTWDSRSIPSQGNAGWGTVNLAAVALDANGQALGLDARDYRRVDVRNDAPHQGTMTATASLVDSAHWRVDAKDAASGVVPAGAVVVVGGATIGAVGQPLTPRPTARWISFRLPPHLPPHLPPALGAGGRAFLQHATCIVRAPGYQDLSLPLAGVEIVPPQPDA